MYPCSAPVQICVWGHEEAEPFPPLTFRSTGWPTPRLFNESMLSKSATRSQLGNCFKNICNASAVVPRELADKELLKCQRSVVTMLEVTKAVIKTMMIIRTATVTVTVRETFVQILRGIIY